MPPTLTPRVGARVLLLDPHHRVLLIHARDPDNPTHHWWELPGGGHDNPSGETLPDTARRELAEETGILIDELGPKLWIRETRFHYRGRDHHRIEHVYLAHTPTTTPHTPRTLTDNEQAGLIEHHWWTTPDLHHTRDKLLPRNLPHLLDDLLAHRLPPTPLYLPA